MTYGRSKRPPTDAIERLELGSYVVDASFKAYAEYRKACMNFV